MQQPGDSAERVVGPDACPDCFARRRRRVPPALTQRGHDVQATRVAAERAVTPDRQVRAGVGYRDDDLVGAALEADIETTTGVTQRVLDEDVGHRAGYGD